MQVRIIEERAARDRIARQRHACAPCRVAGPAAARLRRSGCARWCECRTRALGEASRAGAGAWRDRDLRRARRRADHHVIDGDQAAAVRWRGRRRDRRRASSRVRARRVPRARARPSRARVPPATAFSTNSSSLVGMLPTTVPESSAFFGIDFRVRRRQRIWRVARRLAPSTSKSTSGCAGVDDVARLGVQHLDDAGVRRGHFDHGLGGLHRHHRLIDLTRSPSLTCQLTISASGKPSPRSGRLNVVIVRDLRTGYCSTNVARTRVDDARDARDVVVFEPEERHHRVVAGDALDRRLQVVQPVLGHESPRSPRRRRNCAPPRARSPAARSWRPTRGWCRDRLARWSRGRSLRR